MTFSDYMDYLRGKRIGVIGFGVSNQPLVRVLLRNGCDVTVCAELRQRDEQGERVLAARNADRYPVAGLYHMVMVHRAADIREHFLHGFPSFI